MINENKISKNAIKKISKNLGIVRVSEDSKVAIQEEVSEYVIKVLQKAKVFTSHAGRKTVKKNDILLAIKELE